MDGAAAAEAASPAVAVAAFAAFACVEEELLSEYLYSAASALLAVSAALGFGEARTDASGTASSRASTAARVSGSKASREGGAALVFSSAAAGANDDGSEEAFAAARFIVVAAVARDLVTLAAAAGSTAEAGRLMVPAIVRVEARERWKKTRGEKMWRASREIFHHSRRRRRRGRKNASTKWPPAARPSRLSSSRSAWGSFSVSQSASSGNQGATSRGSPWKCRCKNGESIRSTRSQPRPHLPSLSQTTAYHAFIFFLPPLFRKAAFRVPAAARAARSRWLDAVSAAPRDSATQTVRAIFLVSFFSFFSKKRKNSPLFPSFPPNSTRSSRSATASWRPPSRPRPAG